MFHVKQKLVNDYFWFVVNYFLREKSIKLIKFAKNESKTRRITIKPIQNDGFALFHVKRAILLWGVTQCCNRLCQGEIFKINSKIAIFCSFLRQFHHFSLEMFHVKQSFLLKNELSWVCLVSRESVVLGNFCGARSVFGVLAFVLCAFMCVFGVNHAKMGVSSVGLLVFCVNFVESLVRQVSMHPGIIYLLVDCWLS